MGEKIGPGLYLDEVVERCFDPNFASSRALATPIFQEHNLTDIELSLVHGVMLEAANDSRLRWTMLGLETSYTQDGGQEPDRFTIEHSAGDTNFIATALCVRMGLTEEYLVHASQSGAGHDNWKDHPSVQGVIHYRGFLTQAQRREYIYPHPREGAERAWSNGLHRRVGNAIGTHHGFTQTTEPYGLSPRIVYGPFNRDSEDQSSELLMAMAVAVADVYGSARSDRPDRRAESHSGAMQWVGGLLVAKRVVQAIDELFKPVSPDEPTVDGEGRASSLTSSVRSRLFANAA